MDKPTHYTTVKAYHEETKHHPNRYARSSGYMDWENEPNPFRIYNGARTIRLPFAKGESDLSCDTLYRGREGPPEPFSVESVARFLELALGLSAWKKYGTSEWVLRINPSSGNLHPTEAYLIFPPWEELPGCIAHYNPLIHALEVLEEFDLAAITRDYPDGFGLVLSTICWREAWKYGERAFRYCMLDLGHALGALRFSAGLLGWKLQVQTQIDDGKLDRLLGFDRHTLPDAEAEYADCLCWVGPRAVHGNEITRFVDELRPLSGAYPPNQLSREHVNWEIIREVSRAVRSPGEEVEDKKTGDPPEGLKPSSLSAERVIRNRRSAQAYDREKSRIDAASFIGMLTRTLPGAHAPFDCLPYETHLHLVLFVHNVEGLLPGLYFFLREKSHLEELKKRLGGKLKWEAVREGEPLYLLEDGDFRQVATTVSCHQEIAGQGAFSLGMISRFDGVIREKPWIYSRLCWEAGLIGQVLYLEAEAHGLRGTGIGCYFDDEMHKLLGIKENRWQDLYHFTVGMPVTDTRIETREPYHHLRNVEE